MCTAIYNIYLSLSPLFWDLKSARIQIPFSGLFALATSIFDFARSSVNSPSD